MRVCVVVLNDPPASVRLVERASRAGAASSVSYASDMRASRPKAFTSRIMAAVSATCAALWPRV